MTGLKKKRQKKKKRKEKKTGMLCFANSREANSVEGNPGKAIKTFYVSVDFGVVDFVQYQRQKYFMTCCFTFYALELL